MFFVQGDLLEPLLEDFTLLDFEMIDVTCCIDIDPSRFTNECDETRADIPNRIESTALDLQ